MILLFWPSAATGTGVPRFACWSAVATVSVSWSLISSSSISWSVATTGTLTWTTQTVIPVCASV